MSAMDGMEQRKEEMRDMRRVHWLTDFVDDARYAIRSLRRASGLTAFVVVTLAVGIGMTAATFSMVDALIFRPYPVPHPGAVVSLVSTSHDRSFDSFSYREYVTFATRRKATRVSSLTQISGLSASPLNPGPLRGSGPA